MSELGKVCDHGQLARSCNICELEQERDQLLTEVGQLKAELSKYKKYLISHKTTSPDQCLNFEVKSEEGV